VKSIAASCISWIASGNIGNLCAEWSADILSASVRSTLSLHLV
jgi:hypothetical protein